MPSPRRWPGCAPPCPASPPPSYYWEIAWSFGPQEDEDYGQAGYGRPPGYGPPPLWTEEPYDPPGWR